MGISETGGVASGALEWLKGQPFNNVLIATLLGMMGWIGWYGMTSAIPDHIKTIQAGYERLDASHAASLKSQQEVFEKTLDRIIEKDRKQVVTSAPKP